MHNHEILDNRYKVLKEQPKDTQENQYNVCDDASCFFHYIATSFFFVMDTCTRVIAATTMKNRIAFA